MRSDVEMTCFLIMFFSIITMFIGGCTGRLIGESDIKVKITSHVCYTIANDSKSYYDTCTHTSRNETEFYTFVKQAINDKSKVKIGNDEKQ